MSYLPRRVITRVSCSSVNTLSLCRGRIPLSEVMYATSVGRGTAAWWPSCYGVDTVLFLNGKASSQWLPAQSEFQAVSLATLTVKTWYGWCCASAPYYVLLWDRRSQGLQENSRPGGCDRWYRFHRASGKAALCTFSGASFGAKFICHIQQSRPW